MISRPETRLALLAALLSTLIGAATACKDQPATNRPQELTVAAASDLIPAFEDLGRAFESTHGTRVVVFFFFNGQGTPRILKSAPGFIVFWAKQSEKEKFVQPRQIGEVTKTKKCRGGKKLW
jgi:molybdate transport system substrate-binding protein